jgi:hypothetical protein
MSAVFVEQLGQGGGRRTGLPAQYVGGFARRRQADDYSSPHRQLGDRRRQHRRLAGTGRADDQDEAVIAGYVSGGDGVRVVAEC